MDNSYLVKKLSKSDIRNYKAFEDLSDEELEKISDLLYKLAEIALNEYAKHNKDKKQL